MNNVNELRDKNGLTEAEFLASYQPGDYPRPSVATDMVIFTVTDEDEENYRKLPEKELRVLLVRRGGHPFLGCWALPGGFVRPAETTEEAAERELREETGVDQVYLEQLYTFSQPGRDPRTWVMSCSYMALADSSQVAVQAGDDADDAAWFKLTFRSYKGQKDMEPDMESSRRSGRGDHGAHGRSFSPMARLSYAPCWRRRREAPLPAAGFWRTRVWPLTMPGSSPVAWSGCGESCSIRIWHSI